VLRHATVKVVTFVQNLKKTKFLEAKLFLVKAPSYVLT